MLRAVLFIIGCTFVFATDVQAGAWMREKGAAFTSSSIVLNQQRDRSTMTYLEYGVRDDLTLGADLMVGYSHTGRQFGFGTLFLKRPIGKPDQTNKWAYQLGIGAAWENLVVLPHVEAGLSWGRGLQFGKKSGWATIDSTFRWEPTFSQNHLKIDGTLGLSLGKHLQFMMQVFTQNTSGQMTATLAPSLLIKPGHGKFTLQIGAELPDGSKEEPRLKLGIWRKF